MQSVDGYVPAAGGICLSLSETSEVFVEAWDKTFRVAGQYGRALLRGCLRRQTRLDRSRREWRTGLVEICELVVESYCLSAPRSLAAKVAPSASEVEVRALTRQESVARA